MNCGAKMDKKKEGYDWESRRVLVLTQNKYDRGALYPATAFGRHHTNVSEQTYKIYLSRNEYVQYIDDWGFEVGVLSV